MGWEGRCYLYVGKLLGKRRVDIPVCLCEKHQQLYQHGSQGRLAYSLLRGVHRLYLCPVQACLICSVQQQLLDVLPRKHEVRHIQG